MAVEIPDTKHVRKVRARAEEVGLALEGAEPGIRDGVILSFRKGAYRLRVTFDKRGYVRQAGGNSPTANNWVISVSSSRRWGCSPARALDVLVSHTMPQYAEEVA